jgi:hypothetical protein
MRVPPEILRHLDDLVRLDLQNLRDSYFDWLLAATYVVLVGCAMEGPEIVLDVHESLTRRGRILLAEPHPFWVVILSAVGWLFIVGGIVGEGVYETLVSSADGSLQTFNNITLASASERALNAEIIAKNLDSKNLSLQIDLLKLRREAGARRLTGEQIETMRRVLEHTPTPITVVSHFMDAEASDFADDFRSALALAHWNVQRNSTALRIGYGVSIAAANTAFRDTPEVRLLDLALTAAHVPHEMETLTVGATFMNPPIEARGLYLLIEQHPPLSPSVGR